MTGIQDDLATLRIAVHALTPGNYSNGPECQAALARVEDEIARLLREKQVLVREVVRFTRGGDPDYSPDYQDEYQRLWHEAAARAEAAEAEIARLEAENKQLRTHGLPYTLREAWARAEAAEAEIERLQREQRTDAEIAAGYARLKDGLRRIERMAGAAGYGETPAHPIADFARALLAEDGAAQPRVYPVGDWKHATTECVACPGCAFTFASFHVTEMTGQYDCPVCHAQSRDGTA